MRVFAPAPFRYPVNTGTDYPYGLQDIPSDTLARTLLDAGLVVAPDPGAQTDTNKRPMSPAAPATIASAFVAESEIATLYIDGDSTAQQQWLGTAITVAADPVYVKYTLSSHRLTQGCNINMSGNDQFAFNGYFKADVVDANTFRLISPDTGALVQGTPTGSSISLGRPNFMSPRGMTNWLNGQLGEKRFVMPYNGGIGGSSIADAVSRWSRGPGAVLSSIDGVWLMAGINEVNAGTLTPSQIIATLQQYHALCRAAGKWLYWVLPLGLTSTHGSFNATNSLRLRQVWRKAEAYQRTVGTVGLRILPLWKAFIDPAQTDNRVLTALMQSDGIHPSPSGGQVAAAAIYSLLPPRKVTRPTIQSPSDSYDGSTSNPHRTSNPFITTTTGGTATANSGTISGSVPSTITVTVASGTAAVTLTAPAAADGVGNVLQGVVTLASGTSQINISTASISPRMTAGRTYRVRAEVALNNLTGFTSCKVFLSMQIDSVTLDITALDAAIETFSQGNLGTFDFESQDIVTTGSTINFANVYVQMTWSGTGVGGTFQIRKLDLIDVTAIGAE